MINLKFAAFLSFSYLSSVTFTDLRLFKLTFVSESFTSFLKIPQVKLSEKNISLKSRKIRKSNAREMRERQNEANLMLIISNWDIFSHLQ